MEEGAKTKKTIFVGGISEEVNQESLINAFSTFGDIIDIQIPTAVSDNRDNPNGTSRIRTCYYRLLKIEAQLSSWTAPRICFYYIFKLS